QAAGRTAEGGMRVPLQPGGDEAQMRGWDLTRKRHGAEREAVIGGLEEECGCAACVRVLLSRRARPAIVSQLLLRAIPPRSLDGGILEGFRWAVNSNSGAHRSCGRMNQEVHSHLWEGIEALASTRYRALVTA